MPRFPVESRRRIRQVAKGAALTPDPVDRLRYLQERMNTLSVPAQRRWQNGTIAAGILVTLVLAILIWRAI
jgi:hypothetical protein